MKLVLTCEHAFNHIPEEYLKLFRKDHNILETHEAYDPGAYDLFQSLGSLADFSHYQKTGRLLIETNRSKWHKKLFSRYSGNLSDKEKEKIIKNYYEPYRKKVQQHIQKFIDSGDTVLHISVHSFTPVLNNVERNCDIGLLYDPQRKAEKETSKQWKDLILREDPSLKIRFNYPYLGLADGFTTSLRKEFPRNYSGIELEINQKWASNNKMDSRIKTCIQESLKALKNL